MFTMSTYCDDSNEIGGWEGTQRLDSAHADQKGTKKVLHDGKITCVFFFFFLKRDVI